MRLSQNLVSLLLSGLFISNVAGLAIPVKTSTDVKLAQDSSAVVQGSASDSQTSFQGYAPDDANSNAIGYDSGSNAQGYAYDKAKA